MPQLVEKPRLGRIEAFRELVHLVGEQMPGEVERDLDAGVAEVSLDGLGVRALSDEERGASVAQVVDAEALRHAGLFHGR
jgi:hypothetical protein